MSHDVYAPLGMVLSRCASCGAQDISDGRGGSNTAHHVLCGLDDSELWQWFRRLRSGRRRSSYNESEATEDLTELVREIRQMVRVRVSSRWGKDNVS